MEKSRTGQQICVIKFDGGIDIAKKEVFKMAKDDQILIDFAIRNTHDMFREKGEKLLYLHKNIIVSEKGYYGVFWAESMKHEPTQS